MGSAGFRPMSNTPPAGGRLSGELHAHPVPWEIETSTEDGVGLVTVSFPVRGLDVEVSFPIETADEFIVELRDAIVDAKRQQLEWETDTDPDTGIDWNE